MTDQMDAESFQEYFNVILTAPDSEEAYNRTAYITNHISCLELLLQFLSNCPIDVSKLTQTFNIIVQTLKNRGALLDLEFLKNQLSYFINFITSNDDFLANNKVLLGFCSEAIAYSYRFLFEITVPTSPPFSEVFELIEDPNINFKIIALSIMRYVVIAIKNLELKHTLKKTQKDNAIYFQKVHLHAYFQVAADIILKNNAILVDYALELLESCFQIYSSKSDSVDLDTYCFSPPPEIIQYYQNPSTGLPQSLLQLFNESESPSDRERLSMECLMYFASASENVWLTQQFTRITFLIFTAGSITQLINDSRCQRSEDSLLVTSRLIFKLAYMKLPIANFFQEAQQVAIEFFAAVRDLTIFSFNECLMHESSNFLIKFWSHIVASRFKPSLVTEDFMQLFPQIFDAYIEALGNHDDTSIINSFDEIEMPMYIDSSKYLWQIASISPQSCATTVSDALSSSTETLLSRPLDLASMPILCKIIYLILIISAQFQNRISPSIYHDDEIVNKNIILITSIYNYISVTNDAIAGLFQAADEIDKASESTKFVKLFTKAETALKYFTSSINRDYFVDSSSSAIEKGIPSNTVEKVLFSLPMCESLNIVQRKQFIFDMLLDRFLQDFKTLDEPLLLNELLEFIDDSIFKGSKSIKTLSQNNSLLQSLVQRQFFLEFSHAAENVTIGKLYKTLNQIYVRAIQTVEQLEAFLPYFDQRFQQLQESSYQDGETVYILYSELHGALKGNGNTYLFYFIFHWFMNHVEDTINCINNHNKNDIIIESICKAWRTLCSNKGNKLVLPKSSAEGIKLFQCSLKIIEALANTDLADGDKLKKYIIKIIDPSISYKNIYVNFGIMEHFKDNSFDNMVEAFFAIVGDWQTQVYDDKKYLLINSIIQSIIQNKPSLILEESKLTLITQFLHQAIFYSIDVFATLTDLMELFISENSEPNLSGFRPHFVSIFNILMQEHKDGISDKLAAPIYYMFAYDGEYAEHVLDLISSLFDQKNREEVNEIFKATFTVDFSLPNKEGIKLIRLNITNIFWKSIMKYTTNIYAIDEFRQMIGE